MTMEDAESYWQAITVIEAQELLLQSRVASYPHLKESDREEWHHSMHQKAYPKTHDETALTTEELAQRLKGLNGGSR